MPVHNSKYSHDGDTRGSTAIVILGWTLTTWRKRRLLPGTPKMEINLLFLGQPDVKNNKEEPIRSHSEDEFLTVQEAVVISAEPHKIAGLKIPALGLCTKNMWPAISVNNECCSQSSISYCAV